MVWSKNITFLPSNPTTPTMTDYDSIARKGGHTRFTTLWSQCGPVVSGTLSSYVFSPFPPFSLFAVVVSPHRSDVPTTMRSVHHTNH